MDILEVRNAIEVYTEKFTETGDFTHAMRVFYWAQSSGEPTPEIILHKIAEGFREWGLSDGKKSLDDIFNLKAGKGNFSALSPEWKTRRNKILFSILARLTFSGWKESDAAEAACRWLEEQYRSNPKKYRWLKHASTGRKGDTAKNDTAVDMLSPDSLLKEKRTNRKLFAEAERAAAQELTLQREFGENDQQEQATEAFYLGLIDRRVEKGSPKTTDELQAILVR